MNHDRSSLRILVVDDEADIRKTMSRFLLQAGYQVTLASNGREGVRAVQDGFRGLIFMDIMMPNQDGFESIRTLRQEFPAARVIAITGESDMIGILNYLDVATMLGACRTFQKPFELADLIEAVRTELAS